MEPRHTIGQVARAAGVPTSTVRFYERSRLLRPDGRTEGNYRLYGPAALERLRFIRAAQANGFALEDVAALLSLRDGTTAPCKEVQTLVEQRLTDLEKRVKQLRHLRAVLRASLQLCRQAGRSGRCQVIDRLKVASSSPLPATSRRPRSK
jgi:MerR family mercuric resistance operon transcriptional regulator